MSRTVENAAPERTRPLLAASEVLAVLGVVAFVAGVTKRWILDPLAEAFGELSPDGKAMVAVLVVCGIAGGVAAARLGHRRSVTAARRAIEGRLDG